jgi:hypothetical protein
MNPRLTSIGIVASVALWLSADPIAQRRIDLPIVVRPATLASTIESLAGYALLGVQVTGEVPWPAVLRPEMLERLEIRAAVMATSVRTAEGVELTYIY